MGLDSKPLGNVYVVRGEAELAELQERLLERQRQYEEKLMQDILNRPKPPKPWVGNIAKQKRNQKNYTKH